jgi:hypothetical protein
MGRAGWFLIESVGAVGSVHLSRLRGRSKPKASGEGAIRESNSAESALDS